MAFAMRPVREAHCVNNLEKSTQWVRQRRPVGKAALLLRKLTNSELDCHAMTVEKGWVVSQDSLLKKNYLTFGK